jgi:hypothetical protein
VLSDYGEYAGRLGWRDGQWWIEHARGVTFEVATRSQSCAALRLAAETHAELVCPRLSFLGIMRGKLPLVAARLTLTDDGSVLGVSWHHLLGDLHSLLLLLRAWALAYDGAAHAPPLTVLDRAAYMDAHLPSNPGDRELVRVIGARELLQIAWLTKVGVRRVDLAYSNAELAVIHAAASRRGAITTHDALCAHVFVQVRRLADADGSQLALSVNLRKRLGLPSNLAGNFTDFAWAGRGAHTDTAELACELRESIVTLAQAPLTYHQVKRVLATDGIRAAAHRCIPNSFDPVRRTLFLTSWCNFGVYELRFGGVAPTQVQCAPYDSAVWFGLVAELPARSGLYVRLWLPSRVALALTEARRGATRPTSRRNPCRQETSDDCSA